MGKKPIEFMHPEDIHLYREIFQSTLKTGEGFGEFRLRCKDGSFVWLEVNAKITTDENGEINAILVSRVINERKLIEAQLKESEEKFRVLYEKTPLGILLITKEGVIIDCNLSFENMLGFKKKEVIGIRYSDLNIVPEKFIQILLLRLEKISKGEKTPVIEFPARKKNGETIWIRIYSTLVDIGVNSYIQIIGEDITEKKRVENNLKSSERKYRYLFEESPFTIALLNWEGKIIDINDKVFPLFGYNKRELIGKDFRELRHIIPPKSLHLAAKKYKEFLTKGSTEPLEIQIYKKDSILNWVLLQASFVKMENEYLIQIIVQDITERKRAEQIIEEEFKKLKELDQIRNELLTRVLHELKTPLTSLYAGSEFLLNEYKEQIPNDILDIVEIMHRGGEKLKALVENLIDISKMESNKLVLNKNSDDLVEIVKECANEAKYLIKNRNLFLTLDLPDKLFANVDKIRIGQVITNLLSNAIKNTPSGGKISIASFERDNNLYISIKDTGIGLTQEEMDRLFQKFGKIERYDIELDVEIEGSGLGLYISKEIVDLHGGKIWVESEGRNKGAIFIVQLFK